MFLSLMYVATMSQPQPSSQSSKNDFRFFFFFGGGSIGSCASPPSFSAVGTGNAAGHAYACLLPVWSFHTPYYYL